MLINLTNRGNATWGKKQREAASVYGEILDFPMPPVAAHADEAETGRIADLVLRRIRKVFSESKDERFAVVCQGDFTLVWRIVDGLRQDGIEALAPTFERVTKPTLKPDGTTVPGFSFEFVRFRSYYDKETKKEDKQEENAMGFNPLEMMQMSGRLSTFGQQHPRVVAFFKENGQELRQGTVVEFRMKTPEGRELVTNLRLTPEDEETINMFKKMM